MKLALAQINPFTGDLEGNVERCLSAVETARRQDADVVIMPEMAIPGYPPRDILFDATFVGATTQATADLAHQAADAPPVIVGTVMPAPRKPPNHPGLYNAAVLLHGGNTRLVAAKRLLPAYDVFYEPRWFLAGTSGQQPVDVDGKRVGVLVGEDLWDEGHDVHPAADLLAAGAELLVCIAASPYHRSIMSQRMYHALRPRCPLVYANMCGANDELIFDGRSFVLSAEGEVTDRLACFEEEVRVIDVDDVSDNEGAPVDTADDNPQEELYRALVLGVRDFARKNRLDRAYLGLSGGIDSALVAVIAAEALGPDRITAVAIPSRYTDERSTSSARDLAGALGIHFEVVELERMHASAEQTLGALLETGTGAENIQARLRAMILMSFVNRHGGMVLNTGNKTELALGYSTLYGDVAGTLCPIADLTKPDVVALARWVNSRREVIPRFTLERPPSAELKPDQIDPFDYKRIAPEMERLVRQNRSDSAMRRSEHKRWQMGVVLKVSEKAFGTGRLIPITRR